MIDQDAKSWKLPNLALIDLENWATQFIRAENDTAVAYPFPRGGRALAPSMLALIAEVKRGRKIEEAARRFVVPRAGWMAKQGPLFAQDAEALIAALAPEEES